MKPLWALTGLPATLITGLVVYAVAVEPYSVVLDEATVAIGGLPSSFEGYRILHLSDFEADGPGIRERQVAAIAREALPDVIVVTGDLVRKNLEGARKWRAVESMASWLGSLEAPDGVWFVQGHGEMAAHIDQDELRRTLGAAGVGTLWDEVAVISRQGSDLALAGIRVHDYASRGSWDVDGPAAARQRPSGRPSYLELSAPGAPEWTDYEVAGAVRFSSPEDWVGALARSRLGSGEDRFYMVVRRSSLPFLAPSAHGTAYDRGFLLRKRPMEPGAWHRFRIKVETSDGATRLRARSWEEGGDEPSEWDMDYVDFSATRIPAGAPGLYAEGPGTKEFADLRVERHPGRAEQGRWREPSETDLLESLRSRAPAGAPMILLSHTPDIFRDAKQVEIPLVLAGHTQGGQIRLPWLGALATDTRLGRSYASGLFVEGRTALFVTRGVGTTRIPARLLCPPEAALLTLRGGAPP